MEQLTGFPDVEDLGLALLAPAGPTALTTGDVLTPPLVVLRRTGGVDDGITDTARIQVDCYGTNRRQTADLAELCRQLVLAAPAQSFTGVSVDDAWTESAPSFVAYEDRKVQRYVATYRLSVRRRR